jgi:hypothetical protein
MPETRATHREGFEAGLVALRAQGLEPSDYAKELAEQVSAGEMTPREMEDRLIDHYRSRTAVQTQGR